MSSRASRYRGVPDTAPLLTVREAAARLRVSEPLVRKLVKDRRLPIVRCGRAVRIAPRELAAFIRRNTV